MKKVELTGYQLKDNGKYEVYLGNGTIHQFKSEKAAKRFLSQTNKFLTRQLYDIRNIYIDIWNRYQQDWCFFKHNKKTMSSKVFADDRTIKRLLSDSDESFNLTVNRADHTNGNHFAFKHLFNSIDSLKAAIKLLNALSKKQSNTFQLYNYDSLFRRLLQSYNEIENYSQIEASGHFKKLAEIDASNEFTLKMKMEAV